MGFFKFLDTRFAPPRWVLKEPKDKSERQGIVVREQQRRLISLVGLAAIVLVPIVLLADYALVPGCLRNSLSHYIYSPIAGNVFVAGLSMMSVLLFAFRGEDKWATHLATAAGLGILFVAIFPTQESGFEAGMKCDVLLLGETEMGSLKDLATHLSSQMEALATGDPFPLVTKTFFLAFEGSRVLHALGVVVMAAVAVYICGFTFRATGDEDVMSEEDRQKKLTRNTIYLLCAVVIGLSAVLIGVAWLFGWRGNWAYFNGTLIAESVIFFFFGIAWLVKGRGFNTKSWGR